MDILKKLMFWKKDDLGLKGLDKSPLPETGLGLEPNIGLGTQPGLGQTPMSPPMQPSQPSYPSFQTTPSAPSPGLGSQPQAFGPMRQEQQSYTISKEIEVISSKLDALRAAIDNLSQRLASIERMAYAEQQSQQSMQQPMPRQQPVREMPVRPY